MENRNNRLRLKETLLKKINEVERDISFYTDTETVEQTNFVRDLIIDLKALIDERIPNS